MHLSRFPKLAVLVMALLVLAPASTWSSVPPWLVDPEADPIGLERTAVIPPVDTSRAENREAYDVTHYTLLLVPDFEEQRLTASVTVDLTATVDGLDFIDLDLDDALTVSSASDGLGSVDFHHDDDVLRLLMPSPLDTGDRWVVTVQYSGTPQPTGFLGFDFGTTPAGAPLLATLSQPYGARSWWPCKDTPSDKATVTLRVVVPTGMYAASNGTLTQRTSSGQNELFVWDHEYPVSTYNVSVAASEYASWSETWVAPDGRELPIEYHVFPEHEEAARFDFARTRDILDFYAELFGEYPFMEEKYGMAEFVWNGAMEHQTMVSYGDVFITGDRFYERIIGHELAHHWWGNSITLADWRELWIHEGFATLSEALWVERAEGEAAYRTFLRRRSNSCCGFQGAISPPTQLFNSTVFNKAAWMMHMLRGLLGDTDFFAAVRDLADRPELQYGSIVTDDVIEQFESTTGRPLRWFFDQWLYRVGRPDFTTTFTTEPSGERTRVTLTVQQADVEQPWIFPLQIDVLTSSGTERIETFVTGGTHRVSLLVDGDVNGIDVDPDEWLLRFSNDNATSAPSANFRAARLLPNVPNPFNPRTTLKFELPSPGDVTLRILDARGRLVDRIDAGRLPAGEHGVPWTGTDAAGNTVASGVYRVILESGGEVSTARPITLVR